MRLFYRSFGNSGEPLIILHGLFGISDNWNTLARQYGAKFQVIVPDQRNHGQSPHSSAFDYQDLVDDIEDLIDELGFEKINLIGHSMGGKVAMKFTLQHPERINRLLVADISPRSYAINQEEIINAMQSLDLKSIKSRKEAEEFLISRLSDYGLVQFLLKNLYWQEDQLNWRMNLDVLSRDIDLIGEGLNENRQFEGPVLFIRGEKSGYIKDNDMEDIQNFFPQAYLKTIQGAGHWVHAEKPAEFLDMSLEFLEN